MASTIERFNRYTLEKSITFLGNISTAVDYDNPLDFKEWIGYFKDTNISLQTYQNSYKNYINKWNYIKNTFINDQKNYVNESYKNLIKEISLDVLTAQELNFIKNVDVNNKEQVESLIPLVSDKIKNLSDYYKNFREKVKTQPKRNNFNSSKFGIKKFLYQLILDIVNFNAETVNLLNVYNKDINFLEKNIKFNIENLYDIYDSYFDVSYSLPASSYTYGGSIRTTQWSSNINYFDYDLFLNFSNSTLRLLSSYNYVIEEFLPNLSLPVQLNENSFNYYKNKDFVNQINTLSINDLNLNNNKSLIEKYIGSDWYYLSTGDTLSYTVSGNFLKSKNKSLNYINRINPSTATVPSTATLIRDKNLGGFFLPKYEGMLLYTSFDYTYTLDNSKLSPNTAYYFPDPNLYINTFGNSIYNKPYNIFTVNENAYVNVYSKSNSFSFGYINDYSYLLNFHGYENLEEKNQIDSLGVSRNTDSITFFKGKKDDIWKNNDIYNVTNKAKFTIDERQNELIVGNKDNTNSFSDIYGNNFGLYKTTTRPIFNNYNTTYISNSQTCLFLSNGLFLSGNNDFNYNVSGVNSSIIIPGKDFTTTGLTLCSYPTFTNAGNEILSYGAFKMPWCFNTGTDYKRGTFYDGVYFTDRTGTPLPDNPKTDYPNWSEDNQSLYYNVYLEGGANNELTYPTYVNPVSFLYSFNTNIDCGTFLFNGNNPFNRIVTSNIYANISSYSTTNNAFSSTYQTIPNISEANIYTKKYVLSAASYVRNLSNKVLSLSDSLSSIFLKYKNIDNIYSELNNNIINFNVVYDVGIFETENYLVIEKLLYNYTTNVFYASDNNPTYITRYKYNSRLEKFGNFFYHETSNTLLLYKTSLLNVNANSNYKTIYPEIYKLDINNFELKKIFPFEKTNLYNRLSSYSFRSYINPVYYNVYFNNDEVIYNLYEIDRPNISYDTDTDTYSFVVKGKDLSNGLVIYYQTYKYMSGVFTNKINECYFQNSTFRDENYSNAYQLPIISYTQYPGTKTNTRVSSEGVLKLGE